MSLKSIAKRMTEPVSSPNEIRTAHLRRRHRAERRFKFYGQAAIAVAVSFLIILLISIAGKATSAFSRHMLIVDFAPGALTSPQTASVEELNIAAREYLLSLLPEADATPAAREDLNQLTPRLAVRAIQKRLSRTPELVEQHFETAIALSDELDLYLKHEAATLERLDLGPAGRFAQTRTDTFRLTDGGPDGFGALYDRLAMGGGPAPDLLVSVNGAWFGLNRISGAALELVHLAGPMPALGEQANAPIKAVVLGSAPTDRAISNRQIAMVLLLQDAGLIERRFNTSLFTNSDSTYPELAGIAAAMLGSLFTMLMTAILALPVGVMAAIYLEEFAKKTWITRLIEVNINNLAAVPSIIFGLLGAAVFLNTFGMPRSVPLVGGLVLGLLVLPTIIIASRAALRSVPPSVRDAALGLGASRSQAVFHHVLPLATPGILTGAIIAMARALGETAPLLLIGMVAFISEVPSAPDDEATVLPVLIYKWFSGAERAWDPMTSALIVILLAVLVTMNLVAVLLRRRFEKRW